MLIGRLFFVILIVMAMKVHGQEISIEDVIQRDVVDTCEKLNKPKVNATCDLNFAKDREPAKVDTSSLPRCDRNRKDEPPQKEMKNFMDASFPVSSLKPEEAQEVFENFYSQKKRYVLNEAWADTNVCAQRSQMIAADLLSECKIRSAKIFAVPSKDWTFLGRKTLEVESNERKFHWSRFHVANVVYVEKNGKSEPYVIDPLIFNKIVPLSEWENLFKQSDAAVSTSITSGSVYRWTDGYEDDPTQVPSLTQAISDLERARNEAAILRKHKK